MVGVNNVSSGLLLEVLKWRVKEFTEGSVSEARSHGRLAAGDSDFGEGKGGHSGTFSSDNSGGKEAVTGPIVAMVEE